MLVTAAMAAGDRRREHGVIDEFSSRTVGMHPTLARQVVRDEEDLKYPLLASSLEPPVCQVVVAPDPIGRLTNGLGANWPAVTQGEQAYPRDDDEDGWEKVFAGMTYAGVRWVRYWLAPLGVVVNARVVAEHYLLRRLDRLNRWAREHDATLMLELCRVPPEFEGDAVHDAPRDNREYVETYMIPLLRHLLHERHVDRIRQICLFNEPFNADVSPYIFFPPDGQNPLEYYLHLHELLRAALDREGLGAVGLIGPNTANLFQRHIQMFEDQGLAERVRHTFAELDCHVWRLRFDYYPPSKRWPGYPMTEGIERYLKPTLAAARRLGRELSLTEVGAMYFNDDPRTARNTRHDAFLTMAEEIVRSINAGVAGALVWSYANSGCVDGQWGWIGNREQHFAPVPNLLNGFAALMRYHHPGAAIHPCTVEWSDFSSFISAGALFMPGQGETIWLVNDHPVERLRVRLKLPANRSGRPFRLYRKDFSPPLQQVAQFDAADEIDLVLPGMTFNTLTTLPG